MHDEKNSNPISPTELTKRTATASTYGLGMSEALTVNDLWLGADLIWAGVLRAELLPSVAAEFLARGLDTPALRELAGLDLQPFDLRDATDLYADAVAETSMPSSPEDLRLRRVAHVLAVSWASGRVSTPAALKHFYRLAVWLDYPEDAAVMRLYALDDEWNGGWGQTREQIEHEVSVLMASLSAGHPPVPEALVDAIVST